MIFYQYLIAVFKLTIKLTTIFPAFEYIQSYDLEFINPSKYHLTYVNLGNYLSNIAGERINTDSRYTLSPYNS